MHVLRLFVGQQLQKYLVLGSVVLTKGSIHQVIALQPSFRFRAMVNIAHNRRIMFGHRGLL